MDTKDINGIEKLSKDINKNDENDIISLFLNCIVIIYLLLNVFNL